MNDFDTLIEMMFADGTLDQSVRQEIEGMNDLQKRLHIVKILDKGLGLFTKIESIMNLPKMDYIKGIITFLKDYVLLADVEKKKFGEVMTPLTLVKEMLATLPEEVWSNPELKWLDPANGTGPYPILVIYKLMNGLKDWEPDEEKRYKHIVENMIYVCELQPRNMFLYMCALDPLNNYNLNVYTGSFLENQYDVYMMEVWNLHEFDVVVGNPPYKRKMNLKFLNKCSVFSKKIIFVHPASWLIDEKNSNSDFINSKKEHSKTLESVVIFNGNPIFVIELYVPCCITYTNKNKESSFIKVIDKINNKEILYENINQINKFSNLKEYISIINKTKYNKKLSDIYNKTNGDYFINMSRIRGHVHLDSTQMYQNDFYTTVTKDTIIEKSITKSVYFSFETELQASNFLKYLKTKFCRFQLSICKNSADLNKIDFSFIPLLDFNEEYTDDLLFTIFDLSSDEIKFIDENIPKYY
jgi:hypothetical protein